jgi:uncharacterized protein (TIGR03083 family)
VFDAVYRDARARVAALARAATGEELGTVIPGSPEWTARDVVAHLAGVAADTVAGRTAGAPGPSWTAPQVEQRRGLPLADVLAEWDEAGPGVEAAVADRRASLAVVFDVLCHEADLHEGLDRGRPLAAGWEPAARVLAEQHAKGAAGPGTLLLHVAGEDHRGGEGEPVTELRADPYELFRGLLSRRSRAQMRAWDWSGDPEPYLSSLPAFGPRDDDQPVPDA